MVTHDQTVTLKKEVKQQTNEGMNERYQTVTVKKEVKQQTTNEGMNERKDEGSKQSSPQTSPYIAMSALPS